MVLLGLLLTLAGSAVLAIVFSRTIVMFPTSVEVLDRVLLLDGAQLFWAGAATSAGLLIGLMLLVMGLRRALAVHQELRRARRAEQERRRPYGAPARPRSPAPRPAASPASSPASSPGSSPGSSTAPSTDSNTADEHSTTVPMRRPRIPAGDRLVAGRPRNAATAR